MGKTPKSVNVGNRDGFARSSFLFQLATSTINSNEPLSRIYSRSMDLISKRNVLKLDPHLKRAVCKKCHRVQLIGKTYTQELNGKDKSETLVMKCRCGEVRNFPIGQDRNHVLFTDRNAVPK